MKDKLYNRSLVMQSIFVMCADSIVGKANALMAANDGAFVAAIRLNHCLIDKYPIMFPFGSLLHDKYLTDEAEYRSLFINRTKLDHLIYILQGCRSFYRLPDITTSVIHRFLAACISGVSAALKYVLTLLNSDSSITICTDEDRTKVDRGLNLVRNIREILSEYTKIMSEALVPVRINFLATDRNKQKFYLTPVDEGTKTKKEIAYALLAEHHSKPEDIALVLIYLMKQRFSTGQCLPEGLECP